MAGVTVNLNPALDGALLELRYRSYGLDELLFTQFSVDGRVYWPQGTLTDYDVFQVRFPAQTVNGISYFTANTGTFTFYGDLEYTLNLVALPTHASVTIRGVCTGGTPRPSMLLEIYGDNLKKVERTIPAEDLVIGEEYTLDWVVPEDVSSIYGRMVLSNLLGNYEFLTGIEELGLTLEKWYSVTPTGTAGYPERFNDRKMTTSPNWSSVGKYVELDFGTIVKLREFRYHGFDTMVGDGSWKISYWDLVDLVWKDWMTGIPTRYDAPVDPFTPWETPPAGVIYTDKVRVIATTIDSGMFNDNYAAEFEMRF